LKIYIDRIQNLITSFIYFRLVDEVLFRSDWSPSGWQLADLDVPPRKTLFQRCVWLIPEESTCFQVRYFPSELVGFNELEEAVLLDVQTWSPWEQDVACFYWSRLNGSHWQVAVWIWNKHKEDNRGIQAFKNTDHSMVTKHVMAEQAWNIACANQIKQGDVLTWRSNLGKTCVAMSEYAMPAQLKQVRNNVDENIFFRGVYSTTKNSHRIYELNIGLESIPTDENIMLLESKLPSVYLMNTGKLPSIGSKVDPWTWKKYILIGLGYCFLWLLGSSLILWHKNIDITQSLHQVKVKSESMLHLRGNLDNMQQQLDAIKALRKNQVKPINFFNTLSVKLPKDTWLDNIMYDDHEVRITGKSKNATALGAILESISNVEYVEYIGSIQTDAQTKEERFGLRLFFKKGIDKGE